MSYRLLVADEIDARLAGAWEAARASHPLYRGPYFSPELTRLVARERGDVRIVVIENDGRAVGFFPHQRSRFGLGLPVAGPLSDYHGVTAHPDSGWQVTELLRAARLARWSFDHLVDPTGRFAPHVRARATSPAIELGAGFDAYLGGLGSPPQDFERKARKLARDVGPLTFALHEPGNLALEQGIAWKRAQYRRSGIADVFAVRWTGNLLHRIMDTQTPGFSGACSVLRAGDRMVAVHAGMRSASVLHWWFPAYDPELHKYSPGIILLFRIAEAMAAVGLDTIDLGKGDEPYKRAVANATTELGEGSVERSSVLAAIGALGRLAEDHLPRHGVAATLRLPLRAWRKLEWMRRYQ